MRIVDPGRRVVAVVALGAALSLVACGGNVGAAPDPATGSAAIPTIAGPTPAWLAAFRIEADSNALNADTQAIMDMAGPAIFAGPVACFEGFPSERAPTSDAYVLGVIAPTRTEVEAAVERVGRDPLFVVRVTVTCVD